MNNLLANTINEIQKLYAKKHVKMYFCVTIIICFLFTFSISAFQSKVGFLFINTQNFALILLSMVTNILLPLFIFMVSSEMFSGEFNDRTLKLILMRPISRLKVFISKNIALGIYIVINLFLALIVSLICGMIMNKGFTIFNQLPLILGAYAIDIIPLFILGILASFISQFFKTTSTSLTTSILIYIAMKIIPFIFSGTGGILFTSYLNWYPLWFGGNISFLNLMNKFFMMISYAMIFFTAGFYLFDKKDI